NGDEHFFDGFGVIGDTRDDSAGRSLVEITHAEPMHFRKSINPQLLDNFQCHFLKFQQLKITDDDIGCLNEQVSSCQSYNRPCRKASRRQIIIDEYFNEQGPKDISKHSQNQQPQCQNQHFLVRCQIFQQTLKNNPLVPSGEFLLFLGFFSQHYNSPPCSTSASSRCSSYIS